jgi:flagellar L-ring protein precursor FlgH
MQNVKEKSNIKKQKVKMRKKTKFNYSTSVILLFTFFFLICSSCEAGSIWAKKNNPHPYADDIARHVGDILTIRITEDSKIDNKAKRDLQKDTDRSNTFNGKVGNFADLGEFGLSASSSNNLKSKADLKDERSFEDRVTVTVVDVQPNGNLVVSGTRKRNISGDTQIIEVSGIVRTSDIAFDNTIKSEQVADFRIVSKNAGVAAPYTRPGWLGTILDILWPF